MYTLCAIHTIDLPIISFCISALREAVETSTLLRESTRSSQVCHSMLRVRNKSRSQISFTDLWQQRSTQLVIVPDKGATLITVCFSYRNSCAVRCEAWNFVRTDLATVLKRVTRHDAQGHQTSTTAAYFLRKSKDVTIRVSWFVYQHFAFQRLIYTTE
jgi:hypothetical protein